MTFFVTKSRIESALLFRDVSGDGSGFPDIYPWSGDGIVNITYSWAVGLNDLDTRTYLTFPYSSPISNQVLGWNFLSTLSPYMTWSGDDTGSGGSEYLTINIRNVINSISGYAGAPQSLSYFDIHMGAYYYGDPPSTGANFTYTITNPMLGGSQTYTQFAYNRSIVGIGINEFGTYRLNFALGTIIRIA